MGNETRPQVELKEGLEKLFTSRDFFDLILKCGNKEFKVHKAIVCPRSTVLQEKCIALGADNEELTLDDVEPEVLELMIEYFYRNKYHIGADKSEERDAYYRSRSDMINAALLLHSKLYAISKKYKIRGLSDVAQDKFAYDLKRVKEVGGALIAARHVYASTEKSDRGLRKIVVRQFSINMAIWSQDAETRKTLQEIGELSCDLLEYENMRRGTPIRPARGRENEVSRSDRSQGNASSVRSDGDSRIGKKREGCCLF